MNFNVPFQSLTPDFEGGVFKIGSGAKVPVSWENDFQRLSAHSGHGPGFEKLFVPDATQGLLGNFNGSRFFRPPDSWGLL